MKKVIAILICLLLLAPMISVSAGASDIEIEDEYYGIMFARWDTMKVDGEVVGTDGQALQYLYSIGGLLETKANTITVRGWMFCDVEIEGFGYVINDGTPVMKSEFTVEAEQAVYDQAKKNNVDYATRYEITIDVSDLKGVNRIRYLVKLEGMLYQMTVENSFTFTFEFHQEGTEIEPTPTPDTSSESADPVFFRFNDEELVEEFFMYATNNNHVSSLLYDEEKNCCLIKAFGGDDPNIVLPFYQISLDDMLGCSREISADVYKTIVIIGKFKYDSVFLDDKKVSGTFYYSTDEFQDWQEVRNEKYFYEKTDDIQFIKLCLAGKRYWKGQVYDCRFDFFEKADNDTEYELYAVCFFKDDAEAANWIETYKSNGDAAFPTPAPTPTPKATDNPSETGKPEEPTETASDEGKATSKPSSEDKQSSGKSGCGGMVTVLPAVPVILAAALIMTKKKTRGEND